MRPFFLPTVVIAVSASVVTPVNAADIYVGAGGKYWTDRTIDFSFDATFDEIQPLHTAGAIQNVAGNFTIDDAFGFEAGAGIEINSFRFGVVVDHLTPNASVDEVEERSTGFPPKVLAFPQTTSFTQTSVSFESVYRFKNSTPFTPYIGGRAGVSFADFEVRGGRGTNPLGRPFDRIWLTSITVDDKAFHYSGVAGIEIELLRNIQFYTQGEYRRTTGVDAEFDMVYSYNAAECGNVFAPRPPACLFAIPPPDPQFAPLSGSDQFSFGQFSATAGFRITF